jgi:hypothetical protein
VSSACPVAELHPGELIQAAEGGLTHPGAVIIVHEALKDRLATLESQEALARSMAFAEQGG